MATLEECRAAFDKLCTMLGGMDADTRQRVVLDRTVSAKITDLDVTFGGNFRDGGLRDVHQIPNDSPKAQIRLSMASDDLVRLTAGELTFPAAVAKGKVRISASVLDLLKIKALF